MALGRKAAVQLLLYPDHQDGKADNVVAMSKPPLPSMVRWMLLGENSAPYGNPAHMGQQLWLQNSAEKGSYSALCWKCVVYWVGATHKSEYFPRSDGTADACLHLQLKRQIEGLTQRVMTEQLWELPNIAGSSVNSIQTTSSLSLIDAWCCTCSLRVYSKYLV